MAASFTCVAITTLPAPPPGWYDIDYAITASGDLACLRATSDVKAVRRRNWEAHLAGSTDRPEPYLRPADEGELSLIGPQLPGPAARFALTDPSPGFDTMPDGGWIFVSRRSEPGRKNAQFLSANGDVTRSFDVGDGIESVQADAGGGAWVSYFDEGIFGDSLGVAGIAHFDQDGVPTWSANGGDELPSVNSCYALNAGTDEAWAYYYSDFPILRVRRDGQTRFWNNGVTGAKAIAVDGKDVVLFGGYQDQTSRIALLRLGERDAAWTGHLTLDPPSSRWTSVFGRGDSIHIVGDGLWRRFTVSEIVEAVRAAGDAASPENSVEPFGETTAYILGRHTDPD